MRTRGISAIVTIATAAKPNNSWLLDYEGMLAEVGCRNGPRDCRSYYDINPDPVYCGTEGACFINFLSEFCREFYDWQCFLNCPEGQVLNPLQYCSCIDIEEQYEMFCEPDESDDSDKEEGEFCVFVNDCKAGLECRDFMC